jgi:hypothetical protein
MIAAGEFKTTVEGEAFGLGWSHATEVRDGDLATMDCKPHAYQRRGERDDDQNENLGEQAEKTNHAHSE